jgi:hypothetical protein
MVGVHPVSLKLLTVAYEVKTSRGAIYNLSSPALKNAVP